MTSCTTSTIIDDQFNSPDAELILRSSDGVYFAVHKLILRLASPVFNDMISLPQPSPSTDVTSQPIISMTEDAASLRLLLCFTYPRSFCAEPDLSGLANIKCAAALARKYEILFIRDATVKALVSFVESQPEIAYIVAWKYEYPTALRAAARRCLEPHTTSSDGPEYDEAPATALKKLQNYANAVPAALESFTC